MTAAEFLEGQHTLGATRLEELHALLDEFHQKQLAAERAAVAVTAGPPSK